MWHVFYIFLRLQISFYAYLNLRHRFFFFYNKLKYANNADLIFILLTITLASKIFFLIFFRLLVQKKNWLFTFLITFYYAVHTMYLGIIIGRNTTCLRTLDLCDRSVSGRVWRRWCGAWVWPRTWQRWPPACAAARWTPNPAPWRPLGAVWWASRCWHGCTAVSARRPASFRCRCCCRSPCCTAVVRFARVRTDVPFSTRGVVQDRRWIGRC